MIYHDDQIVLQGSYFHAWTNASYEAFTQKPQPLGGAYRLIISFVPSAIAICVLAFRLIKPLTPKRPRWMTNFVSEPSKENGDLTLQGRKQDSIFLSALLIASSSGLALQIVPGLYPRPNYNELFPILAWAISILLIIIDRPKTAPFGVLVIMTGLFVMQVILLLQLPHHVNQPGIAHFGVLFMISLMISVILFMPMRNPQLSSIDISPANGTPTADLRSPEDNLTPLQYMTVSWMGPLISLGSARQLEPEDVWSLSYHFQHKILHEQFRELKGSVVRRLLAANGLDLILISSLAVITCLARMSVPVLLQQLLRAMEYPGSPRREAITYAALSMLARFISIQASVFKLWYARRCYERSRGEMITMIFEKTLARKIIGAPKKEESDTQANGVSNGTAETSRGISKLSPVTLWRRSIGWLRGVFKSNKEEKTKEPASMGKILNLMRNDVYEVSQRFWEFGQFITTPLTFIFSIILIWKLIGWPCLIGVVTIFIAQGFNAIITRILLRWEKERRKLTDTRLKKVSEFVEAIRHFRWYGWQDFWKDRIMVSRQQELRIRVITSLCRMGITFVNTFASGLFPVVAFYTYTVWAGLPLRIDVAFPALQLFNMLESSLRSIPDLITTLLNAKIAVDRIEDFMSEPDKDSSTVSTNSSESQLGLQRATFAWPGMLDPVLRDINLTFPVGLTLMYGKVAAGKSALLQALLGELDRLGGEVSVPNEMFGYCSQTPWLQSMNIRDNILFSSPYEESRYNEALAACALNQDLAGFKDGDLSNIGENGIGLSGGQKARVALARAVYSRAKILLLDDPLSALDHETAETIVRRCLNGSLTKGRIVVLVTHRTELCHDIAAQMVEISEGTAQVVDRETISPNDLTRMMSRESTDNATEKEAKDGGEETTPDKFIEDEKREHGGVRFSVYWEYIKAGKLTWWAVLVLVLATYRLVDVGETWFLKQWGESYSRPTEQSASGLFDSLPSPEINIRPWLIGFFLFALAQAIGYFITQCFMLVIIYLAGRQMFRDIMTRFSHATFRFYDVTPVGRLMNRMTSDIGTIDGNISYQLTGIVWLLIKWVASIVIIASVTPIFFAVAIALSACFVLIFRRFLPTSQSLRRLEMVSLSPLMSNFGALLEGLVTVRAFAVQSKFQDRVVEVTDAFQRMDHFYWSLQSWLTYRFESLSAVSTFLITLLALYTGVSAGLTAFLLTAASQFVAATHGLCRQYGSLQMDFVSVERVVELLHLDQEPPGTIDPPASWPSYSGDIVFEDVSMRYAEHLEPSLSNISCCIPAGSTAALLGRTGSGKSTLALSLLATIRPESGRILIDGIDISKVSTQALRNRITFLAQDPVLFPGTMRQNLDPLDEYTDDACSGVLERVCSTHGWTTDTQVDAGGKNLSQGQRQLVGLARAVLRRSAIVILDEATASIDTETALQIQQILREELRESTVITIAHRLEAVKDADFFIRLDKGRLVEAGPALAEGSSSSGSGSSGGSGTPGNDSAAPEDGEDAGAGGSDELKNA